jgi:gliding motility-associated-like protein
MKKFIFILVACLLSLQTFAQYTLVRSARQPDPNNCKCYTITPNSPDQKGAVWNNNRIDFQQSFDLSFDVYLGTNDGGADGMAFVFQTTGTSAITTINTGVGSGGGNLAIGGVTRSVIFALDTYANNDPGNLNHSDPIEDHLSMHINGNLFHNVPTNISGPVLLPNIENGRNHLLRITWDANSQTLTAEFDNIYRVQSTRDFVNTVFGGNNLVYWGFTGATGGLTNEQKFCSRQLEPIFILESTDKKCAGSPIQFFNQVTTAAPVAQTVWNFGDLTPPVSNVDNPTHTYVNPGKYLVTFTVTGIDGCSEIFKDSVFVGAIPTAAFRMLDSCQGRSIDFRDQSTTGDTTTIQSWYWSFPTLGTNASIQHPTATFPQSVTNYVHLTVTSSQGCISDTLKFPLYVREKPTVAFDISAPVCNDSLFTLTDVSTAPNTTMQSWNWIFHGQSVSIASTYTSSFPRTDTTKVGLAVESAFGCSSDTLFKPLTFIYGPRIDFRFEDTCRYDPVTFEGIELNPGTANTTQWRWQFGDGSTANTRISTHGYANPGRYEVQLYAISAQGCSSDTLRDSIDIYELLVNAGRDTVGARGIPIQLNATGGVVYTWSPSRGLSDASIPNPIATVDTTTTYEVMGSKPGGGCPSYDSITIYIYKGPALYVPNAFTPNGDGLNDRLKAFPVGYAVKRFAVYNRYGQIIFETSDATKYWDGTFRGKPQEPGTYVWMASVRNLYTGESKVLKGNVLLIR